MTVARPEDVERNRKELVVDPSTVESERSHQQDQVANGIGIRKGFFGIGVFDEPDGKGKDCTSVSDISEHDTEEEGEDGDSK